MIGLAVGVWELGAVAWVAIAFGVVVGWGLRSSSTHGRGGMLDLTPAAVDGTLHLDWSDPRIATAGGTAAAAAPLRTPG